MGKYCQDEWHVFSSVGEQILSFESFSDLWSFIHHPCKALGYEQKDDVYSHGYYLPCAAHIVK